MSPAAYPRVLVYVPHGGVPDRRGFSPSIVACEFAKRMQACGLSFVAAAESDPPGPGTWEGFPVERLPPRRLYRRLRKLGIGVSGKSLPSELVERCKKSPPDLVHAHQLEFDVQELARRVGRRTPVLIHAHVVSQEPRASRGIADRYVAVSDYVSTSLANMGYPPDRIVTIRNGVDTRLFAPPGPSEAVLAKGRFGVGPETPVLAFVGRKQDVKGYPAFLAVAERLLARHSPLLVVAVGANPERPLSEGGFMASRECENRLAATGRFRAFPAMPQADLAELYGAFDVTMLPSLAEPQGMAMIESMAAGCVTITTRVGGIPETIAHGQTGLLVDDPEDTAALYGMTVDVLDHLERFAALRSAARDYAVTHLDWSVSAAKLETLYGSLLA